MRTGEAVMLREPMAREGRSDLAGEIGKVGEVVSTGDETLCTVVYEDLRCVLWDAPIAAFEPVTLSR